MDMPPGDPQPAPFGPPFERGSFGAAMDAGYAPTDDEREQAFYASLIAGLVQLVGVPGFLAPLLLAALRKERTPFFLFHANQSFWFQIVCWGTALALVLISFPLTFLCIGWLTLILAVVPLVLGIVYPIVLAFAARKGEWSPYPFVGDAVLRTWRPLFR